MLSFFSNHFLSIRFNLFSYPLQTKQKEREREISLSENGNKFEPCIKLVPRFLCNPLESQKTFDQSCGTSKASFQRF